MNNKNKTKINGLGIAGITINTISVILGLFFWSTLVGISYQIHALVFLILFSIIDFFYFLSLYFSVRFSDNYYKYRNIAGIFAIFTSFLGGIFILCSKLEDSPVILEMERDQKIKELKIMKLKKELQELEKNK